MQHLQFEMCQAVRELADQLLLKAATDLPEEVATALRRAEEREPVETAKAQLNTILKNVDVSRARRSSICQDPGIISFDVTVGSKFPLDFDLTEILRDATENATRSIPLRQNIVHPLTKKNTTTNTGYDLPIVNYNLLFGKDFWKSAHSLGEEGPPSVQLSTLWPPQRPAWRKSKNWFSITSPWLAVYPARPQ